MAFELHSVTAGFGKISKGAGPAPEKAGPMTCRIQLLVAGGNAAVLRVAGRIQAEHVSAIKELIDGGSSVSALDLTEVTLVDRDVVPFLAACELKGIELRNCPRFLREWVTKERSHT